MRWTDSVLIEKGELTSGSTWHAAAQCPSFIGDCGDGEEHVPNHVHPPCRGDVFGGVHGHGSNHDVRLAHHSEPRRQPSEQEHCEAEGHVLGHDAQELRRLIPPYRTQRRASLSGSGFSDQAGLDSLGSLVRL